MTQNWKMLVFGVLGALLSLPVCSSAEEPVTCLLGALGEEVDTLVHAMEKPQEKILLGIHIAEGTYRGRHVIVCRSGVGKVNAAMVATLLIEHYKPSEVIFSGIAGALNPELQPGDIVIAGKTVHHDLGTVTDEGMSLRGARNPLDWSRNPTYFDAAPVLLSLAREAAKNTKLSKVDSLNGGDRIPRIIEGSVATGDVFVACGSKRNELRKLTKADAVEMEGAAVAQVCLQLRTPCLIVRSISDTADAHAQQDSDVFIGMAAKNSAALVLDIVGRIAVRK